jgi:hypothetical protein
MKSFKNSAKEKVSFSSKRTYFERNTGKSSPGSMLYDHFTQKSYNQPETKL